MTAPLIPTGLNPPNGGTIVASIDNTFSWVFNDPGDLQSAYYIEYEENVVGAVTQNTGWVLSPSSQHTFPAGTFTENKEYKWRVKTKDSFNLESPYSEWVVFRATPQISLTIIYPANDYDQVNSTPTYQHSYTGTQSRFQYQLYNLTTWTDLESLTWADIEAMPWSQLESFADFLLWDSGVIWGNGTSIQQPSGYLNGNKTYRLILNSWDNLSQLRQATRYFVLNLNVPPIPTISATTDSQEGTATFTVINPLPSSGQPPALYNNIYRRRSDFTWVLEATNVIGPYTVPVFASGTRLTYAATAVADDGSESAKSTPISVTVTFDDYWIVDPDTGQTFKLGAGIVWGRMQSERKREEFWGANEPYPSVVYDQARFYRGTFQAAVIIDNGNPREQAEAFRSFVDGVTKKPMLFKTPFGDVFKIDIYNVKIQPSIPMDQYRIIAFEFVETEQIMNYGIDNYEYPPNIIEDYWIVDPDTGRGIKLEIGPNPDGMMSERDRTEHITLMNKYPTIEYGNKRAIRSSFSGWIESDDSANAINRIRALLDAPNKKPLRFISPFGDDLLVDIYNFSFELMENRIGRVRRIYFDFVEVGSIESVL